MTETEVEAPAVEEPAVEEYPPELVRLPVASSDRVVVLGVRYDSETENIGKVCRVVNGHGAAKSTDKSNFITVEDDNGHQFYANDWVHVWVRNQAHPLKPLPMPEVADTVTILRALCCTDCVGASGVVTEVHGTAMNVEVTHGDEIATHLVDFTDKQVHKGTYPTDYVENNPPMKAGDQVYVLASVTNDTHNFRVGTVVKRQAYVNEYRDYLYVTMGNHQDSWVSSWIRAEDVPATMPPVPTGSEATILDVFGATGEHRVGSSGPIHDGVVNKGIRLNVGGSYVRARQWALVSPPARGQGVSDHRQALPKGTSVRVLSVKSADRKALVGKMGVTTADIDPKRGATIVEVDGERVLVTGWTAVDSSGGPARPRFLTMMTDTEVEALIQEVFDVADRLADKEAWCNEYDSVMLNKIGRAQGTIRLTQKYLVEVHIYGDRKGKKPKEGELVAEQYKTIRLFAYGNMNSAPQKSHVELLLRDYLDGADFDIANYWKENS